MLPFQVPEASATSVVMATHLLLLRSAIDFSCRDGKALYSSQPGGISMMGTQSVADGRSWQKKNFTVISMLSELVVPYCQKLFLNQVVQSCETSCSSRLGLVTRLVVVRSLFNSASGNGTACGHGPSCHFLRTCTVAFASGKAV